MGLLLFLYPVAEIYAWSLFINHYSFSDALMLCFTTGVVGFLIMNMQGKATMAAMQANLVQGEMPTARVIHRAAVMFGGILILVPGLISKVSGTLLVFPGTRHVIVWWLKAFIAGKIAKGSFHVFSAGAGGPGVFGARFRGGRGFGAGFPPSSQSVTEERDVIEVQPQSIEHKNK
jgi:UPF0716 protein FxsA